MENTLSATLTATHPPALERAALAARIGEDNKAKDIVVLDMRKLTPLFDYFVIMTCISQRQSRTLAEEIDGALTAVGDKRLAIQGFQASRWIVQDYGDLMIHIFDAEARTYYGLEDLWTDAAKIDWLSVPTPTIDP